jgi:hypothetical protein
MSKNDVSGNKDVDMMLNNREESYRIIRSWWNDRKYY